MLATIWTDSIGLNLPFILYFESSDCSGPALFVVSTEPVTREYTAYQHVVYYPRRTGAVATPQSRESHSDAAHCSSPQVFTPPDHCCCVNCSFGVPGTYAPLGTIDVGGFVPPFRVELR